METYLGLHSLKWRNDLVGNAKIDWCCICRCKHMCFVEALKEMISHWHYCR